MYSQFMMHGQKNIKLGDRCLQCCGKIFTLSAEWKLGQEYRQTHTHTHTHLIFNNYYLSTTTRVTRTCLSIRVYAACISC